MVVLAVAPLARAQTVQTVCSFAGTNGADPQATLTLGPDGNFYGATVAGGITNSAGVTNQNGLGTIFRVATNGILTTLTTFAFTNGAYPKAWLTFGADGALYGTTSGGGY